MHRYITFAYCGIFWCVDVSIGNYKAVQSAISADGQVAAIVVYVLGPSWHFVSGWDCKMTCDSESSRGKVYRKQHGAI